MANGRRPATPANRSAQVVRGGEGLVEENRSATARSATSNSLAVSPGKQSPAKQSPAKQSSEGQGLGERADAGRKPNRNSRILSVGATSDAQPHLPGAEYSVPEAIAPSRDIEQFERRAPAVTAPTHSANDAERTHEEVDGGDWGERMAREILARNAGLATHTPGRVNPDIPPGPFKKEESQKQVSIPKRGGAKQDGAATKAPEHIELGRKDLLFGGSLVGSHQERGHSATEQESFDPESFDPSAPELQTSWASFAANILCVNVYPNGITVSHHHPLSEPPESDASDSGAVAHDGPAMGSQHVELPGSAHSTPARGMNGGSARASGRGDSLGGSQPASKYSPSQFHLRFRDTRDYQLPNGRFFLHREGFVAALEGHLSRLHQQGILSQTVVYFGMVTDPFLSLHKKFDVTMGCFNLFERYQPKLLVVQTRSPMVISALPTLKHLADRAVVVIPIESFLEKTVVRYMPGKPRLAERIVAADGLRRQGVKVNLLCGPVLPYGDFTRDAWDFAEILDRHADYVTFGGLASGSPEDERLLKAMPIAQKLAADKQFFWLRPYSYREVYKALRSIRPEKLLLPVRPQEGPGQLSLFAA